MPSRTEIWQALYGAWRFARLDRNAIHYFDLSHRGTWRSFWAASLCYPGFLFLVWSRIDEQTLAQSSLGHIFLVETIGYVVAWTAFPLAALALCRALRREERGFDFITAYNWSQLLQTALFVLVALIGLVVSAGAAGALDRASLVVTMVYEWYIALVAIGAGGWIAGTLVMIDLCISVFIAVVTASLY